jgi:hypothetical protein
MVNVDTSTCPELMPGDGGYVHIVRQFRFDRLRRGRTLIWFSLSGDVR